MRSESILSLEVGNDPLYKITQEYGRIDVSNQPAAKQSASRTDAGSAKGLPLLDSLKLDRAIALMGSKGEYIQLQAQHLQFAQKKLDGALSPREEKEYAMVLWNLDRIEEAQMGDSLDVLDRLVEGHEQFEAQVKQLYSYFSAASSKSGSTNRRRY